MDAISLALITAIGAGVTSSVTDATKASLVAGYTALKERLITLFGSTHPDVTHALAKLEAAPDSEVRREVLVEELKAIPQSPELVALAETLLQQLKQIPAGSQIISHVEKSAVSYSGSATTYNIDGDQHNTKA